MHSDDHYDQVERDPHYRRALGYKPYAEHLAEVRRRRNTHLALAAVFAGALLGLTLFLWIA